MMQCDDFLMPERCRTLLRCPCCKAPLERAAEDRLDCSSPACDASFPVDGGIPVLLHEPTSIYSPMAFREQSGPPASGKSLKKYLPAIESNVTGQKNAERLKQLVFEQTDRPVMLNIGGKHPTSCSAHLYTDERVATLQADVKFSPLANLISDPGQIPLADESVDVVVIDAVLEHVVDPFQVVDEIHRVLKPGGLVYADTPFMVQVHAGAYDFLRFTHLGHRRLFRRFDEISSGITQGPGAALASAAQYFMLSFVRSNRARFAVKTFSRLTLFWLKYFDRFLQDRPGSLDCTLGLHFLGRKSNTVLTDRELIAQYRGIVPNLYPVVAAPQ